MTGQKCSRKDFRPGLKRGEDCYVRSHTVMVKHRAKLTGGSDRHSTLYNLQSTLYNPIYNLWSTLFTLQSTIYTTLCLLTTGTSVLSGDQSIQHFHPLLCSTTLKCQNPLMSTGLPLWSEISLIPCEDILRNTQKNEDWKAWETHIGWRYLYIWVNLRSDLKYKEVPHCKRYWVTKHWHFLTIEIWDPGLGSGLNLTFWLWSSNGII